MYGQHVGSLNLYYMSSNKLPNNPLWTRKGAIVYDWMYGQLVVPNSQFRVAFQGSRGNGYQGDVSIDDVSFINGDCPARTFCDFENNHLCGWSQDTSDDFDWSFGYGNTTSWNTGPKWDHTYKTSFGNYLYIEGSGGRSPGDRARIESFPQNPTQGSCLEFYYNMKGSGIGTLSAYVKRGNRVDAYPAWTLRGEQGERWFRGFFTVKEPLMTWRIIMEAENVHLKNGESCGYENDPNNKVDWLIYSGPTTSHNTGPSVDHTNGLANGYYLYMEASFPARKGDKALFLSEKFTVNPNFQWCMEFWYHMFGTGAGAFRVKTKYTYPRNKRVTYSRPSFEMEGNFDDKWFFGQANISSRYDFQIVFEGEVGAGATHRSDIAIDDLNITLGSCAPPKPPPTPDACKVKCKDGTCIPGNKVCDFYPDCAQGSDPTDTTDEDGCDGCDFESGMCGWRDDSKGVFDWNKQKGSTSSVNTGPKVDHTKGTALGTYLYVEASKGTQDDMAVLRSPVMGQAHSTCSMTFWYHMYGSSIGELSVFIINGFRHTKLWDMKGNQGNKWQMARIYINRQTAPYSIKFTAERGFKYAGDIAIDDIKFNYCALPSPAKLCNTNYRFRCSITRACVSYSRMCDYTDDCGDGTDEENCYYRNYPYRCDFERGLCRWRNLKDDQFDFTRAKGLTDSAKTGPMFDHTIGTTSGHYVYAESSYPRQVGDRARMASGALTSRGTCMLRFYYHMKGDHIGKLSVKTRECTGVTCAERTRWYRTRPAGNFWVRANVRLYNRKPFQVIIEAEIGKGYQGDIAVDDISMMDCQSYYGVLPTAFPTTTPKPTKAPCPDESQFFCKRDRKCIDGLKRCNFRKDCSDGQDEINCGPCDFEKDECGYKDSSIGKLSFSRTQPLTDGTGGPKTDHTKNSTRGYFVLANDGSGTIKYSPAIWTSPDLARTGPGCSLQFSLNVNISDLISVYHSEDDDGGKTIKSRVFQKYYKRPNGWKTVQFGLGTRPDGWSLEFQAKSKMTALDDIVFNNCALPITTHVCNRMQTRCENGGCIDPHKVCDFTNDCGDKSDEKPAICKNFKERCHFEVGTCNWYQDQDDDFDWTRGGSGTSSSGTGPGTDHTLGNKLGRYMFIESSSPRKPNDTARLNSIVFRPGSRCQMRFFYHMFGEHVDTFNIWIRTSAAAKAPLTKLWSATGDKGDFWRAATIELRSTKNYQLIIEAVRGLGYKGDIAVDDISFTTGCRPDFNATLDNTPIVPTPSPGTPKCKKKTEFNCGDGQCIPVTQFCDFKTQCKNGADEIRCPSSCDFEKGHGCGWRNAKFADIMDWTVHQGKTPSNGTGPPFDHTKGTKEGYYLYMEASQRKSGSYPNAHYYSPMYYSGAYNCKFTFWYNMYHYKSSYSDAKINILYRRMGRDTNLLQLKKGTGDKWQQATVQLPPCPKDFRLVFEGSHYWGTKTDAAIDDWSFDCAEPKPPTSCGPAEFRCKQTQQCIPVDNLCDMERDCCDESDESQCSGNTVLDFESGLRDFVQLQTDDFDFDIQSGKTSSTGTGPKTDHTYKEEHGKYIYTEASVRKENDTAQLASATIAGQQGYAGSRCFVSFWYHMYGYHIGELSVAIATEYGLPTKVVWSKSGDQGDKWIRGKVDLSSGKDFQVIFQAKMGTSYRGDIALDDIVFHSGCNFNGKVLPGGPKPPPVDPCLPDFQCMKSGACIPREQVCDFVEDCPGGTDENNATCGYPQGFEYGLKPWKNAVYEKYDFQLNSGSTPSYRTGPTADARGVKSGYYAYLEVSGKKKNQKAVLTTPMFGGAFSDCTVDFYYHMYGRHVGLLKIDLVEGEEMIDMPQYTTLFELKGSTGKNEWVRSRVSLGRRYESFFLNFTATVGGGSQGDIAIDEVTFNNCSHAPLCTGNDPGKFICENARCINPEKICNFVDDCGDSSDELVADTCMGYLGCNFEDQDMNPCNFTQDLSDDFDWTLNQGWTPSYNTGPTRDHTFGNSEGHYMYIEATGRKRGDKARMISLPVQASKGGNCSLRFYYHMQGKHVKDLNVYILRGSVMTLKDSANGEYGDVWAEKRIDLTQEYKPFRLVFEGVVGASYMSDIAIDDIILNPDCLTNGSRVFPIVTKCRTGKFKCRSDNKCLPLSKRCNGVRDCRDSSDEELCDGSTGKQTGGGGHSTGVIAAIVIGALVALLVIVLIGYIVVKKKRDNKLHLFSVFYDPTKQPEEQKKNVKEPKAISMKPSSEGVANPIYDEEPMGDFSIGELDTDMFTDDAFTMPTVSTKEASGMSNPLYQDPYMADDDGPLDNF